MRKEQNAALQSYLEQLLQPEWSEPAPPQPALLRSSVERLLADVPLDVSVVERAVAAVETPVPAAVATVQDAAEAVTSLAPPVAQGDTRIETFRAELPGEFQTLIFLVGKLPLALPLHLLGGIVKLTDPPTPLFGTPSWFCGLQQTPNGQLQAVDSGMYLFQERYESAIKEGYRYLIRIGSTPWALMITDLCGTRVLADPQIRWFPSSNGRPWIAGIIKEEKCALLNAAALVERFQNESQKKPANAKKPTKLEKSGKTRPSDNPRSRS